MAEVLITLGIIGVVAALTMPSLVMHHKKRVVETRLAKFYSNINQAITMSEVENGDKKDWLRMEILDDNGESVNDDTQAITSEEWFNKYLAKYINVIKTENSETAENKYDLYFSDGSMVTFSGSSWIFYPEAKDYKLSKNNDTGFNDRNRKDNGKSNFTFKFLTYNNKMPYYYNKGVEPFTDGYHGDINTLKNNSALGCYAQATNEHAYCTELIRRNGWKIPDDYPWFK